MFYLNLEIDKKLPSCSGRLPIVGDLNLKWLYRDDNKQVTL